MNIHTICTTIATNELNTAAAARRRLAEPGAPTACLIHPRVDETPFMRLVAIDMCGAELRDLIALAEREGWIG